jgi:hypothetical protein
MAASVVTKFFAFVGLFILQIAAEGSAQAQFKRPQGTFSSLRFNSESGDVLGYEVRIVPVGETFQAVVQVAEGEPGPLHVVAVSIKDGQITFDVPFASDIVGRFVGKVTKTGLVGRISLPNASETVQLKRSRSYWDSATSSCK